MDRVAATPDLIDSFLERVAEMDGTPGLSEHKAIRVGGAADARVGAWMGPTRLEVLAVAAAHARPEGGRHWSLEVVVGPGRRTNEGEDEALTLGRTVVADRPDHSLWVWRDSQEAAAARAGYELVREVIRMERSLPVASLAVTGSIAAEPISWPDDAAGLIAVNNRAFFEHREAGALDEAGLLELASLPWFDPEGIVVVRDENRISGFCWTKLHPDGFGEIYRLAVDPDFRGRGLARALTLSGLADLRERQGALRAMLWVDGGNTAARDLYLDLGFTPVRVNRELELPGEGPAPPNR